MDDRPDADGHPTQRLIAPLTITGLGPGDLSGLPAEVVDLLQSPEVTVVVRTLEHPSAEQLAAIREVVSCDDLYTRAETFDDVYTAVADRVMALAASGPVVYAVPGSPLYAERSVSMLRERCASEGRELDVLPTPSFLDAVFAELGIDPAERGFQVLDGRDLPTPLTLHLPTVIFHVDVPLVMADVVARLGRTLPDDVEISILADLGTEHRRVRRRVLSEVRPDDAGLRTSLFLDPPPNGLTGAIAAMRRLREECPWDRQQNHETLAPFAVEEVFELVEAISRLAPGSPSVEEPDYGAYAELEDELGDVLLQVIFHANLAAEAAAFDIEDVGERLREKLVRRHPHVFADVQADTAEEVIANWHQIKSTENDRASLMDGVPVGVPGLSRAVEVQRRAGRVGFDWDSARHVVGDVEEELAELVEVIDRPEARDEMGDVLFAAANLARHLDVDPEVALRRAVERFERRFRRIEELGDLEAATVDEMNRLWDQAKREQREG